MESVGAYEPEKGVSSTKAAYTVTRVHGRRILTGPFAHSQTNTIKAPTSKPENECGLQNDAAKEVK